MSTQITLTLDNDKYNVLRCSYGFNRDVDYRGRPTTGMLGGDIKLIVESTDNDDYLWDRLSGRKPRAVSGKLEIFDAEAMPPFRTLEWYDGYIYAADEGMSAGSALPMTYSLLITTKRLDINSIVQLDRRFPQTYGFWWEEYKPQESTGTGAIDDEDEEDDSRPQVIKIVWKDPEGKEEIPKIPEDGIVSVYAETKGIPEGDEVSFMVPTPDGGEKRKLTLEVGKQGITEIKNVDINKLPESWD